MPEVKGMKKKAAALLALCLLLPCAGLADVKSQVNAPAHVTDLYQSHTGKTVIDVDAQVHVPDADKMFIIPVKNRVFDDSMVSVLGNLIWPGLGDRKMETEDENDTATMEGRPEVKKEFHHSAAVYQRGTRKNDYEVQAGTWFRKYPHFDEPLDVSLSGHVKYDNLYRRKKTINYDMSFPDMEINGDIDGHPLTRQQVTAIGDQLVRSLTDEPFELFSVGQSRGHINDDKLFLEDREYEGTGYSYTLAYARTIEGVTVLPCYGELMNLSVFRDDLFVPPVGYEQLLMAVNREGQVTSVFWDSPYAISGERTEQALLPFEKILAIARQTLPLKFQANEVREEIHYLVYRIDLGYMAVLQRETLGFALTPVWNFYGCEIPDDPHYGCMPLLTVNAADGTVIDLEYGY